VMRYSNGIQVKQPFPRCLRGSISRQIRKG
jgi:hypothetical protein